MELCSRVLAEVETGDSGPGVPGPSSLLTEGSGEPVPDSALSHCSITEEAGASLSHPSTAGLMGATTIVVVSVADSEDGVAAVASISLALSSK